MVFQSVFEQLLLAAAGVFGTGNGWPDIIVAAIMAALALQGAATVVRQSLGELRQPVGDPPPQPVGGRETLEAGKEAGCCGGLEPARAHPRTAPAVSPNAILRCTATKKITTGKAVSVAPAISAAHAVPRWVFGANWKWRTFDYDLGVDAIDAYMQAVSVPAYGSEMAAQQNANAADLEQFKSHGGKLILWHGLEDPNIPTLDTIAYYERLIASQSPGNGHGRGKRKVGLRRTQEFARLFLLPGIGHCFDGSGPDRLLQ